MDIRHFIQIDVFGYLFSSEITHLEVERKDQFHPHRTLLMQPSTLGNGL
jgi:hypothetical protein